MTAIPFAKGLVETGDGLYDHLQPDGGWGWSNAGLSVREAAHDIRLGDFYRWGDSERIAVNVSTLYREYSGDTAAPDGVRLFGLVAELKQ